MPSWVLIFLCSLQVRYKRCTKCAEQVVQPRESLLLGLDYAQLSCTLRLQHWGFERIVRLQAVLHVVVQRAVQPHESVRCGSHRTQLWTDSSVSRAVGLCLRFGAILLMAC